MKDVDQNASGAFVVVSDLLSLSLGRSPCMCLFPLSVPCDTCFDLRHKPPNRHSCPSLLSPSVLLSLHSISFRSFPAILTHTHASCSGHSHQQGLLLPSDSSLESRPAPSSSLPAHSTPRTLPPLPRPKVYIPPPFRTKQQTLSSAGTKKTSSFLLIVQDGAFTKCKEPMPNSHLDSLRD